ncbi:MAG: hypothetical protein NTY80_02860 [candidate division SR1 bacterium]|nr:hypothetical protein [candidate division SR1 bacterium]
MSLLVQIILIARKNISRTATILIQKEIHVAPNKEARVQEELSSTTPTHVPMTT